MLPSYGLLKNVNCPFYAVGLCNRPFCHFGHLKKDDELLQIEEHDKKKKELKSSSTSTPPTNVIIKKEQIEVIDLDDDNDDVQVKVHDQKPDLSTIKIKKEIEQNDGEKSLKSHEKDKQKSNKRKHSSSSSSSSSPRKKDHHHHKDKERERSPSKSPSKSHKSEDKDKKSHHHHHHKEKEKTSLESKNSKDFDKLLNQIDKIHSKKSSDEDQVDDEDEEEELMDLEFEYSARDVDEDADQVEMECYQLFKEYNESSKEKSKEKTNESQKSQKSISSTASSSSKIDENSLNNKRLAHHGASDNPISSKRLAGENFKKPKTHRDAVQTMLDRFNNQTKAKTIKENPNSSSKSSSNNFEESSSNNNKGKKPRMSSVGNVQALLKKPFQTQIDQKPSASTSNSSLKSATTATTSSSRANSISDDEYHNQTIAKTNPKGEKRMAHVQVKVEKKETKALTILPDTTISSKIPFLVRQKMLQRLYEECTKIYPESDDAVARALIEETELAQRCQSRMTYQSSATNTIFKIRKTEVNNPTIAPEESSNKNGVNKGKLSHHDVLAGKTKNSWSIFEHKKSGGGAQDPNQLYKSMARYILNNNDLIENGYPRPNPNGIPGHVIAKPRKPELSPVKSDLKVCDRCSKEFRVDEYGFPVKQEKCFYHHGRRFKKRVNGLFEGRLSCCDGDISADGCSVANTHVIGGSNRNLCGFVSAILDPGDINYMGRNPWDIIGLDCEMIYTTQGPELARVTVVGFNSQIIYDQYVKTTHPVLDYNTRFSGINEEDLANEETTILNVQAVLLANIRPNSIIIGHSLESDLLALKLCHNCCIDTAVVFPHKMGLPYKRALRNLSSEILGKIIQVSEFGHDSSEDARSALELVLWKIKNTKEKTSDGPI